MANENNYDVYKPEWIPEGAKDEQYPGFVMTGVNVQDAKPKAPIHKPKNYTAEELIDVIINKNRMLLSKDISIIYSIAPNLFEFGLIII